MTDRSLFTIGYEKALLADLVATLAAAGVTTLIDVRDRPVSRRPGFSKRQLAAAVEEAGMSYVQLKALGTPPEGREANHRREWERFWPIVEEKLATARGRARAAAGRRTGRSRAELPPVLRGRLADLPSPPRRRDPRGAARLCVSHLSAGPFLSP